MPLVLAIETSNPSAAAASANRDPRNGPAVALGEFSTHGAHLLALEPVNIAPREDDLLPAIDRLFRAGRGGAAAASPRDLALIAVSVGPGGFTAIRVACAAAKAIADATGARTIAIPTALILAQRSSPSPLRDHPFAIALASKADSIHITPFPAGGWHPGQPIPHGRIATAADLPALNLRTLIADSHLPPPIAQAAATLGIALHPPVFDAAACLELSTLLPATDPADLNPLYPRQPEAVTLWKTRRTPN